MMKSAGIKIIYSLPGLKVHAKVALVRRKSINENNKICDYAYIGTGNFNEKTATLYADCGLFTCNPKITKDLHTLFQTLQGKENSKFSTLLVARFNLIPELNRLIDHEIELAEKGKGGRIILKMNGLQDPSMIDRLYEASQRGVQIDLIVRGICCLIPGVKGETDNIQVRSIVGRYLEHSRIYIFGTKGREKVYIASADFMTRNTLRRVEVAVPIYNTDIKMQLIEMFITMLSDNVKAREEDHNGNYKIPKNQDTPLNSQEFFYKQAYLNAENVNS